MVYDMVSYDKKMVKINAKTWLQMTMCKWEGQARGSRHDDQGNRAFCLILDYLLCLGHGCPVLFRCVLHMSIASMHIVWVVSKHVSKSSVKTNITKICIVNEHFSVNPEIFCYLFF